MNYNYQGLPKKQVDHQQCQAVQLSCCLEKSGMFDDLNHYWETMNNKLIWSNDLQNFSSYIHNMYHKYHEIYFERAKILIKKDIPVEMKKGVQAIIDKAKNDDGKENDSWIAEYKKCYKSIRTFMHGIMCSMCSPETSLRIIEDRISFDIREAAVFSRDCGKYLQLRNKQSHNTQVIADIMSYDNNGDKIPGHFSLNFIAFWDSDEDYTIENIKANTENCKLLNDDFTLASVNPSSGCHIVIRKYMGIGPLIKFDQKLTDASKKLDIILSKEYQALISKKPNSRRLQESTEITTSTDMDRILAVFLFLIK